MSVNITRNEDGTFNLLIDGSAINDKSYCRINRLNDNSNYYQLWPNEECFYLYHQKKRKFARNSITDRDADLFKEIRHYSYKTHSFAAYRSDSSQAHLIYENGDIPKDVFIEIGDECDDDSCSRPVKYFYTGHRWCFYSTKAQQFIWPKESGYLLSDNQFLCGRFNNGFFSIYYPEDGVYQLVFYDKARTYPYKIKKEDGTKIRRQGHLYFFDYRFCWIRPYGTYLVCRAKNGIYYVFNTLARDKNRRLCTSVDEPIFTNDLIFISSESSKQIFFPKKDNDNIIENVAWKRGCNIKVCQEYVFVNNLDENCWKIYSLKDAHEVYTGLNIVDVEVIRDSVSCKAQDQNGGTETYNTEDIKQFNKQWLQRMSALLNENQNQNQVDTVTTAKEGTIPTETQTKLKFPDHIDFVISTKVTIRPNSPNIISFGRKVSQLQPNNIIFFYDPVSNKIFIVHFRQKTFYIIHSKQFDNPLTFASSIPNRLMSCFVDGLTDDNYLEKIKKVLVKDDARRSYLSIDEKQRDVIGYLKKKGFNDDVIHKALQILFPNYSVKEKEFQKLTKVKFTFKDKDYSLAPGEEWRAEGAFATQQFLNKADYIAVLVDKNFGFREGSEVLGTHYEMKGQGKNPKEDQSFEGYAGLNINGIIRDNKKRVLLFMKKDKKVVFFDEVECVSSREEREYYGDNYRKIIKFFLRSKIK